MGIHWLFSFNHTCAEASKDHVGERVCVCRSKLQQHILWNGMLYAFHVRFYTMYFWWLNRYGKSHLPPQTCETRPLCPNHVGLGSSSPVSLWPVHPNPFSRKLSDEQLPGPQTFGAFQLWSSICGTQRCDCVSAVRVGWRSQTVSTLPHMKSTAPWASVVFLCPCMRLPRPRESLEESSCLSRAGNLIMMMGCPRYVWSD